MSGDIGRALNGPPETREGFTITSETRRPSTLRGFIVQATGACENCRARVVLRSYVSMDTIELFVLSDRGDEMAQRRMKKFIESLERDARQAMVQYCGIHECPARDAGSTEGVPAP